MTEEDFKLKKIANRFIRRNGIDKEYDDCVSELIIKTFITAYKLAKHRQKTDLHLQLTEKDKQIENLLNLIVENACPCDYCPRLGVCQNEEGTCAYADELDTDKKVAKTIRKWVMKKLLKE